jgi:hypothetical protein
MTPGVTGRQLRSTGPRHLEMVAAGSWAAAHETGGQITQLAAESHASDHCIFGSLAADSCSSSTASSGTLRRVDVAARKADTLHTSCSAGRQSNHITSHLCCRSPLHH